MTWWERRNRCLCGQESRETGGKQGAQLASCHLASVPQSEAGAGRRAHRCWRPRSQDRSGSSPAVHRGTPESGVTRVALLRQRERSRCSSPGDWVYLSGPEGACDMGSGSLGVPSRPGSFPGFLWIASVKLLVSLPCRDVCAARICVCPPGPGTRHSSVPVFLTCKVRMKIKVRFICNGVCFENVKRCLLIPPLAPAPSGC